MMPFFGVLRSRRQAPYVTRMSPLRARVEKGRLILNEPTTLPESTGSRHSNPQLSLFVVQRDQRIDSRRSTGRKVTRDTRDEQHERDSAQYRRRVRGRDAE